jgi:hypothetical protein
MEDAMTRNAIATFSAAMLAAGLALSLAAGANADAAQPPASVTQGDSLRSEFLFDIVLTTGAVSSVGSEGAARVVIPVTGGTFEGPNVRGTVVAPSGDWTLGRPDGSLLLDVRLMLQTDDNEKILMTWRGVYFALKGAPEYARILPMFETGSAKYAWLNHLVAVGVHQPIPGKVVYRVYRIL